jgi:hypothetical protein
MSKVTDRLDNQNIVNLAKQNYEKTQRSKVPGYVVTLPSKGLIYPQLSVLRSGVVEMRYMTAYDEDILSNASYLKNGTVLDRLIDGLLLTEGVSVNDIGNPDLEALLIAARIYGYGKTYPVMVTEPNSGKLLQRDIDLSKIPYKEFNLIPDDNGEFEYQTTQSQDIIKFKYLTKKEAENIDAEHSVSDLMKYTIQSINGSRDRSIIEEYIKYKFLAADARAFREYLVENLYGLDFNMQFEGEDGSTFSSGFRIGPDLFWI